jgi:hypothetical protein
LHRLVCLLPVDCLAHPPEHTQTGSSLPSPHPASSAGDSHPTSFDLLC